MTSEQQQQQKQRSTTDDFQFIKKLGEGAYSSVFKSKRKADGQYYAIKKVNMKALSYKQKQNSLNEVRILASIKNKNIIQYKQAFFQGETLFVIMQYADNGDLFAQITRRRKAMQHYKQEQIWVIFFQICSGLRAMHELNIIHRDLKSANVFLNKNGAVKLGDMNVSKVGSLCSTQTGTPYYASPEVWKDVPYDAKSDIWSLGCVLYEIATLFPPFRGTDMEELYNKVVKGDYQKIPHRYSENLAMIISKVLEKSPIKRPTSQLIMKNIKKLVPSELHQHPIIQQLIIKQQQLENMNSQAFSNGSKSQLLKTINFPNRKKMRKNSINGNNQNKFGIQRHNHHSLTSLLPLPSYKKSGSSSVQNSKCQQNNSCLSISQGDKKQKGVVQNSPKLRQKGNVNKNSLVPPQVKQNKPVSLFLPSVNIQIGQQNKENQANLQMKKRMNAKMAEMQKYRKGSHQRYLKKVSSRNIENLPKQDQILMGRKQIKSIHVNPKPSKRPSKSSLHNISAIKQTKQKPKKKVNNQMVCQNKENDKLVLPSIQKGRD